MTPGVVKDTDGKEFLTKLTKAVPKDSSGIAEPKQYETKGSAQIDAIKRRALEQYVSRVLPLITHGTNLGVLTQKAKRVPGFADELKKQRANMKGFIQLCPQSFRFHESKVYPLSVPRGALDAFARSG